MLGEELGDLISGTNLVSSMKSAVGMVQDQRNINPSKNEILI
jgi:hypothetical protein